VNGVTSVALATLPGSTLTGSDAVVVCHCCVYNFTLSARHQWQPLSKLTDWQWPCDGRLITPGCRWRGGISQFFGCCITIVDQTVAGFWRII